MDGELTSSGSMPIANVRHACGSRSMSRTLRPASAKAALVEATVVVLATPPFDWPPATIREFTTCP